MYYGTYAASEDGRALASDASQPRPGSHHEARCGDSKPAQRTNWAWGIVARHDDWMDSHTPFAQFAHLD